MVMLFLVCCFFHPDQGMVSWPTADITCDYCSPESTVTIEDIKRNGNKNFGYEYRNTGINFLFPLTLIGYIHASLSGGAYCFKYALGDSSIFVHFHTLFKWEVLPSEQLVKYNDGRMSHLPSMRLRLELCVWPDLLVINNEWLNTSHVHLPQACAASPMRIMLLSGDDQV